MLFPQFDVFVDGGGNDHLGVQRYLKKLPKFDKVYVFEPNPYFHDSYDSSDLILINKAIWTFDGTLPFYVSKDVRQVASSLIKEKLCKVNSEIVPFFHDVPINVECVDFSRWLKENIRPNHNLFLKLDIEGAEYEVLWKMIDDGTISLVKKLFVEFHHDTVWSKRDEHDSLVNKLVELGVVPNDWD